jgi:Kef-type K+ transport system membrane component KefB
MHPLIKLLVFITVPSIFLLVGYYIFRLLNHRIRNSETRGAMIMNTLFLVLAAAILFFTAVFLLIKLYAYLATPG